MRIPVFSRSQYNYQDMAEVFFVDAGTGIICIDGEEYPLEPGNCIAVEPGKLHEIINNSSNVLVLTYFGLHVDK